MLTLAHLSTRLSVNIVQHSVSSLFKITIDARFDKINERFEKTDEKLDKVTQEINQINVKLATVEIKLTGLESQVRELGGTQKNQLWSLIVIVAGAFFGITTKLFLSNP